MRIKHLFPIQKTFFFSLLIFIFLGQSSVLFAATDTVEVELLVEGCNNNSICESRIGETLLSCPADCTSAPTPEPSTPSTSNGAASQSIYTPFTPESIFVDVNTDSAVLFWKTKSFVRGSVYWGATEEYELGNISEISLGQSHQIFIKNLMPGKRYFYRIDFDDVYGRRIINKKSFFTTQFLPDINPPVNPTVVRVVEKPKTVEITWRNPLDADFETVRITRSTTAYPRDPFEGRVVYEGDGNFVVDKNKEDGVKYYYAIFARDSRGNYSSGTVFVVGKKVVKKGQPPVSGEGEEIIKSPISETDPLIKNISLNDFIFSQERKKLTFSNQRVLVDGTKALTVSIPYERLPEVLKTIVVHIHDPEDFDKTASFMLRVDDLKTSYVGTIGAFYDKKNYKFEVEIFDFKNKLLHSVGGYFEVKSDAVTENNTTSAKKSLFRAILEDYLPTIKTYISVVFLDLFFLMKKLLFF